MSITRERLLEIIVTGPEASGAEQNELARMALAAMDSEPVEMPLDYLQGHKDGLEWAARLAEANHPETGDWLYDDPIELAKAIRKGPDMPPAQPVADSEPVIVVGDDGGDALSYRRLVQSFEPGTKLYRHAQPAPVVPEEKPIPNTLSMYAVDAVAAIAEVKGWNACRAAMLQELKKSAGTEAICRSDENVQVLHTKSPAQSDCCPAQNSVTPAQNQGWIPVSEQMPEDEQEVLTINKMGYRFVSFFDKHSGLFFDRLDAPAACCIERVLVTHWMPLPADPQEVNHG
ncbi:DUF551 domain-containing protein [Klebsiella pneumoniae]|uniref:DUF551 domain-containing protein n=1 Tax=Klebsiella pneumoniae TaxID=573 RepID=UPI002785DD6E|nr:DUF551 domain-containing protein [Klebsiella pneumoniae]MDT9820859.1 DUF551 domain-containing protein [Klebsiella pneumoniae]HDS9361837.1 DUF551 domain-containing protein [Klebsiella pneumoniae subsp. pneumoniae]